MNFLNLDRQRELLRAELDACMGEVLDHGKFILGPEVHELELELARRARVDHCVGVSNGSDALLIALMAMSVKPGDEVVMPGFNYAAATEMVLLLGAKPVFADVCKDTYNIDPDSVEEKISPATRAIIAVDLFGQCADYDALNDIVDGTEIAIIEDAAQSFGASYRDSPSCSFGDVAITSFFPSKPLGCYGDGGAVFTNNQDLAQRMRKISRHGQAGKYQHEILGMNARLDTLQAAILLCKLTCFDREIEKRNEVANAYAKGFAGLEAQIGLPSVGGGAVSTFAQYTIEVDNRDAIKDILASEGIPTAVHYPLPLYRQAAFRDDSCHLPNCEAAARRVLSLPSCPYITKSEQLQVIEALVAAVSNAQSCVNN